MNCAALDQFEQMELITPTNTVGRLSEKVSQFLMVLFPENLIFFILHSPASTNRIWKGPWLWSLGTFCANKSVVREKKEAMEKSSHGIVEGHNINTGLQTH